MEVALIICIPITAAIVSFAVLKAVQLGLKWQVQVAAKKEPELKTPIQSINETIQNKKAEEIVKYTQEQMREWNPFGGGR
jgi:hypothetical protein